MGATIFQAISVKELIANTADVATLTGTTINGTTINGTTINAVTTFNMTSGSTMNMADGVNMEIGDNTGSQIGTVGAQKLAFWGSTPIQRPSHINDSMGMDAAENAGVINEILLLLENVGLMENM
jgi:hypothetical protein